MAAPGVIDATDIALTATAFNNRQGVLRAANNAIINATTLDNSDGSLSAKGTLNITAPNLNNSNGEIIGDNGVVIRTSSPTLGGTIASQKDVTLTVDGGGVQPSAAARNPSQAGLPHGVRSPPAARRPGRAGRPVHRPAR